MNPMNQRDLQEHVTILGWLYVVGHTIFLAIGAFVFLLLVGLAPVTGEPVQLLAGRYGPYVTDGQTNASLPRDMPPEETTFEKCFGFGFGELLAQWRKWVLDQGPGIIQLPPNEEARLRARRMRLASNSPG